MPGPNQLHDEHVGMESAALMLEERIRAWEFTLLYAKRDHPQGVEVLEGIINELKACVRLIREAL